jgi:hypothetical protein
MLTKHEAIAAQSERDRDSIADAPFVARINARLGAENRRSRASFVFADDEL